MRDPRRRGNADDSSYMDLLLRFFISQSEILDAGIMGYTELAVQAIVAPRKIDGVAA